MESSSPNAGQKNWLAELLESTLRNDPAARSRIEVLLLYPGVRAQLFHRLAHPLHVSGVPFLPRLFSELGRFFSGIEIHPGAKLGRGVVIDHGMGCVIGETAEVGDYCLLYQGVTLGGTELLQRKRHPTLEAHVVVGAGAKVLGDIRIGSHSRIGANSVVIDSCPPNSTVVGIPGKILRRGVEEGEELKHQQIRPACGEGVE